MIKRERRIIAGCVLIAAMFATTGHTETPGLRGWQGPKPAPPCTCHFRGEDMPLGRYVCAEVNGQAITLECTKVLNNTHWKRVRKGCELNVSAGEDGPICKAIGA